MLIKTSEKQFKWTKNQYMSRRRRIEVKRTLSFLSLKGKTWLSIIAVIGITAIPATFGWQARQSQKVQDLFQGSVEVQKAWAMAEPTMPPLAPKPEREKNIALIHSVFGEDAEAAIKVFTCESGLRTEAMNPRNADGFPDVGIAQIHVTDKMFFSIEDMKNPVANLYQAKRLFDTRGWQPWYSSNSCHHMWK